MYLLACQIGEVATIRITTEQLKLLSRACRHYSSDMDGVADPELIKEMDALAQMCSDTARDPGEPGTIHGFAL